MSAPRPAAGDELAVDADNPRRVYRRPPDGAWTTLDGAEADLSQPDKFKVRGKANLTQPWDVEVIDDRESDPRHRRGVVQAEAWAY